MSTNSEFSVEFIDNILFGDGLTLGDYVLRKSPVSETVCYTGRDGRQFYLSIGNDVLYKAALERLVALGVKTIII